MGRGAILSVCAIGAVGTLGAYWWTRPTRNVHGNPSMERLIGSCVTQDGVAASLYRGEAGATVGYWYTVTTSRSPDMPERQIFFSYSTPVVSSVSCVAGRIELATSAGLERFSDEEATALRDSPRSLWHGMREREYQQHSARESRR